MKRCVRKAGLELSDYLRWGGYTRARDFIDMNPGWSLREFQGLMLEERAERDAA